MKKVLIAGGAGFIGSHLAEHFLSNTYETWVIDNFLTGSPANTEQLKKNKNFHCVEADLITDNLDAVVPNKNFDIVYHLASPASPLQYFRYPVETLRVNAEGTHKLLEYVRKKPETALVYASTSEVYGDPLVHPQRETYWGNVNPAGIRACYDEAKRYGEALCTTYLREYRMNIRIARIFNTYGPRMQKDDGRAISNFMVQALQNKPLVVSGDGTQTRSFCYVSDMVEALVLLGEKNVKGEIINLGNPDEKKIIDIARMIKYITHSSSDIVFEPRRTDDPRRRKPDIGKAQKLLGWKPSISLDQGLRATRDYFKNILV